MSLLVSTISKVRLYTLPDGYRAKTAKSHKVPEFVVVCEKIVCLYCLEFSIMEEKQHIAG